MAFFLKMLKQVFIGILAISVVAGLSGGLLYFYFARDLPPVQTLRDVQLQIPLKVYSRDGLLIGVYGEKRRKPLKYEELPTLMVGAFLAAEDDRFFEHPGVDYQGLLRAVIKLALTGEKKQGGSTITMQLARNFFLTSDRTYVRKIKEILLALRIEKELSKPEILTLYLNKIYLGSRAYGVGAAAEVFYGKEVSELDLAQIAMIAGLPKAPSGNNPVSNPSGALQRRNYVLRRMYELDMIDAATFNEALSTPITASRHDPPVVVDAPYIGEMVRQEIIEKYGEQQAYEGGLQVFTTVLAERQNFASKSLRKGLLEYDRRHGYRGPESRLTLDPASNLNELHTQLEPYSTVGPLIPGIVQSVDETKATVVTQEQVVALSLDVMKWARSYINENAMGKTPAKVSEVLNPGDVIRLVQTSEGNWQLSQLPQVTGALVSLNPQDGAIEALVGGFDFYQSNFNRAVQARRQPGSSFKPFIYSAALEHGFTPATIINDAPVVFEDRSIEDVWRPQNYSGQFFGPTRLRQALTKSRNMVSIRVLRDIGRSVAIEHIAKFGFDVERMPRDLTLALGSAEVTPLELATAYTLFANRGFRVEPYLIDRIMGPGGEELYKANPARACDRDCQSLIAELDEHEAEFSELGLGPVDTDGVDGYHISPRMVDEANIYLMDSMMKDVIRFGTGVKAKVLGRSDIAGKTGTTNQQKDAWFSGYQPTLVTTVWVGFDAHKPLGRQEVGGVAALPIWIDYMRSALQGVPESIPPLPEGMVVLKIDPESGLLVDQQSGYGIEEIFKVDQVPALGATFNRIPASGGRSGSGSAQISNLPEQLF